MLSRSLLFAALLACPVTFAAAPLDHAPFTKLLQAHVKDGVVDYPALGRQRKALEAYLTTLRATTRKDLEARPEKAQLAFWLNLYNAETLALILDHPGVGSIRDIGGEAGPWKLPRVPLFGRKMTLDEIEHAVIRERFLDARVHFALVCAAKSCPPLRSEAYVADRLDAQLDEQARAFLRATSRFDEKARTLTVSTLFEWFQGDFERDAGSVQAYIVRYLDPGQAKRIAAAPVKLSYAPYDWSLNGPPHRAHAQ